MNYLLINFQDWILKYNLDWRVFIAVYIFSIPIIYFGAFLALFGTAREINFKEIFSLDFSSINIHSFKSKIGLILVFFGFLMPYLYIFFIGQGVPIYFKLLLFALMMAGMAVSFKKIFLEKKTNKKISFFISKQSKIIDQKLQETMWNIYNNSFAKVNLNTPCQQSIRSDKEFYKELKKDSVAKYLLFEREGNEKLLGFGLVTNDLLDCPWVSSDFFRHNYPSQYERKLIHYFMGIVIDSSFRSRGLALKLLENIIDDIPQDAILGFDHSYETNRKIPYFTHVVRHRKQLKKYYIDKQVYYLVRKLKT